MEFYVLKGRRGDNISRQILLRSLKVICEETVNKLYQLGLNNNQNEMKNTYLLYILYQVLKLPLIIIYKIKQPI